MIPVRIPSLAKPVLASERVFDIAPDHPLSDQDCPVCDLPLIGQPVVLVFAGIAPGDRKPGGWTTGAAVTVHDACATGRGTDETEVARLSRVATKGFDAMTREQDSAGVES